MAANRAMIATTQITSNSANPSRLRAASRRPAGDVGRRSIPTLLPVRAERDDVEGAMLAGRSVKVGLAPRIHRNGSAFEVRPVPRQGAAGRLHQRSEPFGARGISPGIQIEEIESAGEALNLDLRGLDL